MELPVSRSEGAMADTKVYLLDGGTLVIDGFHVFWNRGPAGEVRFPCYSVLIEHQDGRYIFDTGYDYDHVMRVLPFEKPLQAPEQTTLGQLKLLGLSAQDINYVINSHYHFDHCGGNKHFTTACTICHAKELEVCGCPQPFEHLGYSDLSFAPEIARENGKALPPDPALDIYTPTFQTLQGDQEIAKGVWLFETPGHTAGHYSMMVQLAHRRPMLFTADACYSRKNLDMMCISSFHLDPVANLKSMQRLKDLAEKHDAELFFSHDAESFATYQKGANFYS
jgi:4-pyridoxolactonase